MLGEVTLEEDNEESSSRILQIIISCSTPMSFLICNGPSVKYSYNIKIITGFLGFTILERVSLTQFMKPL